MPSMFRTPMLYIARSSIFDTERAFDTDYPVNHVPNARRTNHEDDIREVPVYNITETEQWDLNVHGFCIIHAKTCLDLDNTIASKDEATNLDAATRENLKRAYWYDIEAILHDKFPEYSRIESYDYTIRRRDQDFPTRARTYNDEYEQPARRPHSDGSVRGAYRQLEFSFPGQESFWKDKEFDILNVWRPLKGPNNDWPLALCDWTTIDQEADIRLNDGLRRDRIDENSLLHYSPSHKWYYVKDQTVEDLIVFRQTDSTNKLARGFHCGVFNPNSTDEPRQSVEVRLVAFR